MFQNLPKPDFSAGFPKIWLLFPPISHPVKRTQTPKSDKIQLEIRSPLNMLRASVVLTGSDIAYGCISNILSGGRFGFDSKRLVLVVIDEKCWTSQHFTKSSSELQTEILKKILEKSGGLVVIIIERYCVISQNFQKSGTKMLPELCYSAYRHLANRTNYDEFPGVVKMLSRWDFHKRINRLIKRRIRGKTSQNGQF